MILKQRINSVTETKGLKDGLVSLDQIIGCPNCYGGWCGEHECCVCETRGFLVVDGKKTMDLPRQPKMLQGAITKAANTVGVRRERN
jgi:hypothetical protein